MHLSRERINVKFSEVRDHLEDIGVGGTIILKWIFKKFDGGNGLNWSELGKERVADSCECGIEHAVP
jgi:hypothetical protein